MIKVFDSPGKFAKHLEKLVAAELMAAKIGLEQSAILIYKTAISEFGYYQPKIGNFPAWQELADSTKQDRIRQGYTPNDPLLRSGELRDSISYKVDGLKAYIGSTSYIMVYEEFGTSRGIPPRPVLGPAAFRNKAKIHQIMGTAAVRGLIGHQQINALMGYDIKI